MDNTSPDSSTGSQVKEKRTRRRKRVSCVECAIRRQKCDRQYPCGLCVSRGVSSLCRWASGPFARPTPARAPVVSGPLVMDQGNSTELSATVKALSERLISLERTLIDQNTSDPAAFNQRPPSGNGSTSVANVPTPETPLVNDWQDEDDSAPPAPLQRDVHEAAVTLAQLSLAHHGEYIGSGSILGAIHKLGSPGNFSPAYSKSTESTTSTENQQSTLDVNLVQTLASQGLPPRRVTDALLLAFFTECNWRFGLCEKWFRTAYSRMWHALDTSGTCVGPYGEQINANWLFLLFAVLALAPADTSDTFSRHTFFIHALTARRLAEDAFLTSPFSSNGHSVADGTVLGCVATALISSYLAARGRVSEAWKLVGSAIRAGQAAGMHRDPRWVKGHVMSEEERVLRSRGWWTLVVCDHLYSNVLGRPVMFSRETMDVPSPAARYSDGSEDPPFDIYQATLVKLCEVVGQADLKYVGPHSPSYAAVLEMDRRYDDWLDNLPEEFRWHSFPPTSPTSRVERIRSHQRHNLAVWFLECRMNLHRSWLTRATPPVLTLPAGLVGTQDIVLNSSREKCITVAMELVRMQCAYTLWKTENSKFSRAFFVFDGAVTLIIALAYAPDHPSAKQCIEAVEQAMENLQVVRENDGSHNEIAYRATEVLEVLKRAGGWTRGRGDDQHYINGEMDGDRRTSFINSPGPSSQGIPSLENSSRRYTPTVSHTRVQPPLQPSIPFLAPLNLPSFSTTSGIFPSVSQPTAVSLDSGTRNEEFANPSGGSWNGNVISETDVHMMMPFDMLQGIPLDEAWENAQNDFT